MESIRGWRIVVVAESDHRHILAARLRRMEVTKVTGLEEARRLCQAGAADACLVVVDGPVLDCVPAAESEACGTDAGVKHAWRDRYRDSRAALVERCWLPRPARRRSRRPVKTGGL